MILNSSPKMWRRAAVAARGHVDLAGIGLGVGDELGNGFGRQRRRHHHEERRVGNARDRREIADEIEAEVAVERGVEHVGQHRAEHRVAVGRRARGGFGADVARKSRPVLDHERLAEQVRQPLPDEARHDVGRVAGRKADHDPHRPRRIGLRERAAGCGRQQGRNRRGKTKTVRRDNIIPSPWRTQSLSNHRDSQV